MLTGISPACYIAQLQVGNKPQGKCSPLETYTDNKYGKGFPPWKRLRLDSFWNRSNNQDAQLHGSDKSAASEGTTNSISLISEIDMDQWAKRVIESLINMVDASIFEHEEFFILKLNHNSTSISPKWAFQFDRMQGIIRDPGTLITQISKTITKASVPEWSRGENAILRFIDSVYVCRPSVDPVEPDAFSDIL
jgi:hypothetical protein